MKLKTVTLLIPIFGTSLLGGCLQTARTVTDTFCFNYELIKSSRADTPETLKQIKGQNAVYDRLCKKPVENAAKLMLSK